MNIELEKEESDVSSISFLWTWISRKLLTLGVETKGERKHLPYIITTLALVEITFFSPSQGFNSFLWMNAPINLTARFSLYFFPWTLIFSRTWSFFFGFDSEIYFIELFSRFSSGTLGPVIFGLGLRDACLTILFFNLLCCAFPSYM